MSIASTSWLQSRWGGSAEVAGGSGMQGEWRALERRREAADAWPGRLVAIFVAAMLGVVGWKQFASEPATPPVPVLEAAVAEPGAIELPTVVEPPVRLYQGPPPSLTGRESFVGVYECVVNGQRVVSDRPCAPDAQPRTLVIDQPDPREVAVQRQRQWQAQQPSARASSGSTVTGGRAMSGSASASNAARCEAVDRAIDDLNARMRQRYGAAEGERLRARWHELKRERYDLKCGR